jgi:hypothetical protein
VTTIDNRIVSMQFENRQFEDGVQTTISSLDKLKKSLELEKSAQSLSELEKIGDNFQLDGISKAVDTISDKFSMMGIIAITTLMNIVNSAVDAGAALVKSLAIDPPMEGFRKYEDKTTSVQTIMNATGMSIEDVNEQLDKLLWFTDETSYNFVDMVNNIGKFTSQGISLDTSVTAMQGIANWAALSGQNASTASRAMYNLAQAIGMGKVTGRDWMSIENANMATKEFKTTVIETAKAMKILDKSGKILKGKGKGLIVTAENFSSTLASGWFSSDLLMNSLDKYGNYTNAVYEKVQETGMSAAEAMEVVSDKGMELGKKGLKAAQVAKTFTDAINATRDAVSSGWMRTWEILFGNIEEAMVLWTDFTAVLWDVFASGAEARNELLLAWKELGGRDRLLEGIAAGWEAIIAVLEPVKEAFRDIFPPQTAEALYSLTRNFKALMLQIKIGDEAADNLRRTFRGFFAAIDIVLMALDALRKSFGRAIRFWFPDFQDGFLGITAPIGDYIVQIRDALKASDFFNESMKKVEKFLKPIGDTLKWFAGKVTGVVSAYLEWITLEDTILAIKDMFSRVNEYFQPLTDAILGIGTFLQPTVDSVKQFVSDIITSLNEFGAAQIPGLTKFMDGVKETFKPFEKISTFLSDLWTNVKLFYEKIKPTLVKIANYIGTSLSEFGGKAWTAISNLDFDGLFKLLNDGVLIAIMLGIRKFIIRISQVFDPKGDVMQSIVGVLDQVRDALKTWQTSLRAAAILSIANALLQIAIAVGILSLIDPTRLAGALVAISVLFAGLVLMFKELQKLMAVGDGKGIDGIGQFSGVMLALGTSMWILAFAVKTLAEIDPIGLARGLGGVMAMMALMIVSLKQLSGKEFSKELISAAIAMTIFSLALNGLANVVAKLGALDPNQLGIGLASLAVVLYILVRFFNSIDLTNVAKSSAISFVTLAASIYILAHAVRLLGGMDVTQLAIGMGSLYAILGILSVFINSIDDKKIVGTAFGINALAVAMLMFAGVVALFGIMPIDVLAKGLGALIIIFITLSVALYVAASENVMLAALAMGVLAAALALLIPMISMLGNMDPLKLAIGIGAFIFAIGALVAGLYILSLASDAVDKVAVSFVLLGMGIGALGAGTLLLAAGLAALAAVGTTGYTGLAVMAELMIMVFDRMLTSITNNAIKFVTAPKGGLSTIFSAIINMIITKMPEILAAITAFGDMIKEEFPKWMAIGMMLIISFFQGIRDRIGEITQLAIDIVVNFINGISQKMSDIINAAAEMIISFINGLADSIEKNYQKLADAVWRLITIIVTSVVKNAIRVVESFIKLIDLVVTEFGDEISAKWEKFKEMGKQFIEGIIAGIVAMGSSILRAAEDVIGNAVQGIKDFLGIKSPSKVGEEIGKFFDMGIAQGIGNFGGDVSTSAEDVGENAVTAMQKALLKVDDLVSSDMDLTPVITPVIDLTNVKDGISSIDEHFGSKKTLNVDGNVVAAGVVAGQIKGNPAQAASDAQTSNNQNITFNQNNYSPKALSRVEIYRQTKNQITSLKGVIVSS